MFFLQTVTNSSEILPCADEPTSGHAMDFNLGDPEPFGDPAPGSPQPPAEVPPPPPVETPGPIPEAPPITPAPSSPSTPVAALVLHGVD